MANGTSGPGGDTQPASTTLVVGPEDFLAERAVATVVRSATRLDPETEVTRRRAGDLTGNAVAELVGASLFGSARVLVITDLDDIQPTAVQGICTEVAAVPEGSFVVMVHPGGSKGQRALKEIREVVDAEVTCARITRGEDLLSFVRAEARASRGKISQDAAQRLVEVLGQDLRALAAATAQLVADSDGPVTLDVVSRYFEGRAEVKGWTIADLAVAGDTDQALLELRWALSTGTAPVLVVGALATSVRTLARLQALPRGVREADVARDLRVPPWKIRVLRTQLRGWRAATLADAIQTVAQADLAVKGESNDAALALTRAVLRIGELKAASPAA